jgi:hypothetical protein
MPTVETRVQVAPDGSISGHAPDVVPPGEHAALIKVEAAPKRRRKPWRLPVDDCGPWPEDLSLRREDLHGRMGDC